MSLLKSRTWVLPHWPQKGIWPTQEDAFYEGKDNHCTFRHRFLEEQSKRDYEKNNHPSFRTKETNSNTKKKRGGGEMMAISSLPKTCIKGGRR